MNHLRLLHQEADALADQVDQVDQVANLLVIQSKMQIRAFHCYSHLSPQILADQVANLLVIQSKMQIRAFHCYSHLSPQILADQVANLLVIQSKMQIRHHLVLLTCHLYGRPRLRFPRQLRQVQARTHVYSAHHEAQQDASLFVHFCE